MLEDLPTIRRRNFGRNHAYYMGQEKLIGVTTALNALAKPALVPWAGRTIGERLYDMEPEQRNAIFSLPRSAAVNAIKGLPWAERDAAANRGTEVHALAEKAVKGEAVEVPDELVGHVESAVTFMNEWKPRPVLVEAVVASRRWKYAGTFDLLADMPDGRRLLLDWKTSASGIWPETALQLAAYRHAEVVIMPDGPELPVEELAIDDCAAVWVRADGYDLVPVEADQAQYRAFLHILYTARVMDVMKDWVKPPVYAA